MEATINPRVMAVFCSKMVAELWQLCGKYSHQICGECRLLRYYSSTCCNIAPRVAHDTFHPHSDELEHIISVDIGYQCLCLSHCHQPSLVGGWPSCCVPRHPPLRWPNVCNLSNHQVVKQALSRLEARQRQILRPDFILPLPINSRVP